VIVPATLEHAVSVCERLVPEELTAILALHGDDFDPHAYARRMVDSCELHAWLDSAGYPQFVGGLVVTGPEVAATWLVHTEGWRAGIVEVTGACRLVLDTALESGLERIECRQLAAYRRAHRWYRHLGLRFERQLPGLGRHGEDFVQFVRKREEVRPCA